MSRDSVPLFLEKRSWWFVALPEIYLAGCASLCFFFLDSKEDAERPGTRVESYSKLNRRSRTFCRGSTVCRDHTSFFIFVYTVWWIWAALVFKNYDNDPEICCIRCSGYSGDSRKEFNRVSWFSTSLFLFLYILVDFLIRCFNQRSLIMKNQQTAIWTKIYRVHIKKKSKNLITISNYYRSKFKFARTSSIHHPHPSLSNFHRKKTIAKVGAYYYKIEIRVWFNSE